MSQNIVAGSRDTLNQRDPIKERTDSRMMLGFSERFCHCDRGGAFRARKRAYKSTSVVPI